MNFTNRDSIFNQNSPFKVKKNGFDLSFEAISSWDMGKLYPFPAKEVYPNDTLRTSVQWKMLLETLKKPIYSDLVIKFKNYGVAYRNLWKHWRNFYTRGRKGDFEANLPVVNINCKSNVKGSLFDYLGFPVAYDYYIKDGKLYMKPSEQSLESNWGRAPIFVSAFPFIAYDFVYFWNFINSEIQENIIYNIQDNINNHTSFGSLDNPFFTDFQVDENNLFSYESLDFYSSSTRPCYLRCLKNSTSLYRNLPSGITGKATFNSVYGISDRYSFTSTFTSSSNNQTIPGSLVFAVSTGSADADGFYLQNIVPNRIASNSDHEIVNVGFLYNVNWERDYFTSAHLRKQLGDPIAFPIDSNLKFSIPNEPVGTFTVPGSTIKPPSNALGDILVKGSVNPGGNLTLTYNAPNTDPQNVIADGSKLYTSSSVGSYKLNNLNDLLNNNHSLLTSSFFMNDLRLIGAISMLQEGTLMSPKTFEYSSYLDFFFGRSPNTRDLQQPYFIGGFNSLFYTQEVVQQSGSTGSYNNLGDYAGKGQSIDSGYFDSYTHDEIGLELLLMYIVPKKTLQSSQGINRMWLRKDSYDFYNPVFSHLGFQEIQKQELYVSGDNKVRQEPFGYTMAWNELRYMSDVVTSDMRDTLDVWHLGRKYHELPKLNSDYLLCRPSKRVFDIIDVTTPVITGRVNIITSAYRDLPELGIPELFDHRY